MLDQLLADGHLYAMNLEFVGGGIFTMFITMVGFIWKASNAHSKICAEIDALKVADAQRKAAEDAMNVKIDNLTATVGELRNTITRLVTILEIQSGENKGFHTRV